MTRWGLSLFLILAVLGCRNTYRPPTNTLVVALSAHAATLDPRFATDATGIRISDLIFNGLVRVGDGLKVEPDAAEKWTRKGKTLIFDLRPDLKFHNGRALRAEDVLYTFEFYRSPRSPYASGLGGVEDVKVESVEGHLRVSITLHHAFDSFLINELPSIKLLPKEETLAAGDDFNHVLIGTGPYRFVRKSLNSIELRSVSARTENLVFKVVRDDFTRFQKMWKGEVDIAQNEMGPDKVKDFLSQPDRFQVQTYPGLNMVYMLINFHDKWLSNPIVRRALAHAIDRQSIIQYKLFNLAEAATSILSPINPFFSKELQNPEFDSKKSADLIRSAGAVEHTLTLKTSNDPTALAVGRVLAHQLRESGLKIKHESYEWATYYADIKKGAFELATMKWVGIVDPDIYRAAFLSTETPPGRNRGFYKNPQVDTILNQAQKAEDFAERSKLFGQVQRLVHQDLAIIPLWYDRQVAIAQSNIRDYHPIATSDYRALTKVYKETH